MANTVTEIDKYLSGNRDNFYKLITDGWGKKDKDVIEIKKLWDEAEDAVGTNSKIDKFKKLQDKLNPFFDRAKERLKKDEATLKENDALAFPDPTDQADHEFDKSLVKFSEWPEPDKFANLTLEDAYGDEEGGKPYDIEQMTKLAEQYGYDYRNKDERAEFLSYVSKAHQNRELDKIWDDGSLYSKYAGLVMPITKEYARKNYDKINGTVVDGLKDIGWPLAADVSVGALMAGIPGSTVANKAIGVALDNTVAPLVRQAVRVGLNDVPVEDAAKDFVSEVSTNIATPVALHGGYEWVNRAIGKGNAMNVQSRVNEMANSARSVSKKIKEGQPWMEAQYGDIGDGKNGVIGYTYKRLNKNSGKVEEISAEQFGKSKHRISEKEMGDFGDYMTAMRGKRTPQEEALAAEWTTNPEVNFDPEYGIEKKMRQSSLAGKDPISDLNLAELSTLQSKKPKETIWNWAKSSRAGNDALAYLTNLQGQTKYGGQMINGLSLLDPTNTVTNIMEHKKVVDPDDPEVKMYKRNYKLHEEYPYLVDMPKKPDKYKDFSIEEIFGE